MKIKTIVVSGIVAALYVAIMAVINPFAFLVNQFRVPEMLNHLVVFNKKYFFGIVIAVFVSNLLFSPLLPLDLIFGVAHSIISLSITIVIGKLIKNNVLRMIINTFVFSFMMFIIAFELVIAYELPFIETWISLAISEFLVMGIGIIIMVIINKSVNFKKMI